MAERPTLVDPPIEDLLSKVGDSKFTLVAVSAIRAREINEYYNGLGSGHGALIPPQVTSLSNKSLSLALEELYEGKLEFHRPTPEELAAEPRRRRRSGRARTPRTTWTPSPMPSGTSEPSAPFVVLGVAGGVAAYKSVELTRLLVDAGYHVAPVLTPDAERFVGAATFSALASEPARTSLFSDATTPIPHTYLGQNADLVVVAPATAHLIARFAMGLADDLLTATLLATRAPVVLCPAMHTEMWEHPACRRTSRRCAGAA